MPSVLAVDDLMSMRHMMSMTLSRAGFEVIKAVDGQDALGKAEADQPDVILADIDMPNMDGIELARSLRTIPRYKETPILLVSTKAQANEQEKAQAKAVGANGWLCKPLNPDQLVDTIAKVLK